jgi:hypothetical protein
MPEESKALLIVIQLANSQNCNAMLNNPLLFYNPSAQPPFIKETRKKALKGTCAYSEAMSEDLIRHLVQQFKRFYIEILGPAPEFQAKDFFGPNKAKAIVKAFDQVCTGDHYNLALMEKLLGGQMFDGQIEFMVCAI